MTNYACGVWAFVLGRRIVFAGQILTDKPDTWAESRHNIAKYICNVVKMYAALQVYFVYISTCVETPAVILSYDAAENDLKGRPLHKRRERERKNIFTTAVKAGMVFSPANIEEKTIFIRRNEPRCVVN